MKDNIVQRTDFKQIIEKYAEYQISTNLKL